jgi:hypothetical protein
MLSSRWAISRSSRGARLLVIAWSATFGHRVERHYRLSRRTSSLDDPQQESTCGESK